MNITSRIVLVLITSLWLSAQAAVPPSLNYQGYLTDADGAAIDGNVVVTFAIYATDLGGVPLWSDAELVAVDRGLFSVELGGPGAPFPGGLFNTPLWLGINVDGDGEMLPRRPLTTVGFSFKADDALSLQGQGPAAFDQSGHLANMSNPHGVTAAQAGAATSGDIADLQAQLDAALASIAQLQSDLANEIAARIAADNAEITARIADVDAEEAARIAADAAIADNTVLALDGLLSLSGSNTALFDGVNVQVVNGTGSDTTANGVGNLIVGYDAERTAGDPVCSDGAFQDEPGCTGAGEVWSLSHKSGSHNVVIGSAHNYSRTAGLVGGINNTINGVDAVAFGAGNIASGPAATVTGGSTNVALGSRASVSGGAFNLASGSRASVSGGFSNTANGTRSSVSGGSFNSASGENASISGGDDNDASGLSSSVSGGQDNVASNTVASVSGGEDNLASGERSSVSGGRNNRATARWSSVSGGGGTQPIFGNEAYAEYSSILGGYSNATGIIASGDRTIGFNTTVSGGIENVASGEAASVTGGQSNIASGSHASVSGGSGNTASGNRANISGGSANVAGGELSTVGGGEFNIASGNRASVSGGGNNTASGTRASISGGLNNIASNSYASISGGEENISSGFASSVSGGHLNTATGNTSSVTGGWQNAAEASGSTVTGGQVNTASGLFSSVSGGVVRSVSGNFDWRAGSLFESD